MNRKKALLLITAFELMLMAMLVVLFFSGVLSVIPFIITVLIVGIISSTFTVLAVRKLPPM
jgi:hypothetical protein